MDCKNCRSRSRLVWASTGTAMTGLIRFALTRLDAERAHHLAIAALQLLPPAPAPSFDDSLGQRLWGMNFAGPVGLAPGFDKDARIFSRMARFGFGFTEVGTLTPLPQAGNARPRLFRLTEDSAVINRMGFNNGGQDGALVRLAQPRPAGSILGINIGANKDSADRIADYVAGVQRMAPHADYLTVNISSPNTPGLRALQDRTALDALLERVMAARGDCGPPVWLKVAPDLTTADIDDIAAVAMERRVDALVVSNTTISRPAALRSPLATEAGGLSGAPLRDLALRRLKDFRSATGGGMTLIGVGGIASGADAYARIRAGASLVQLYSAMVFEGPWLAARINRELVRLLQRDGLANIAQAVGIDAGA